jgi:hypothetical protein
LRWEGAGAQKGAGCAEGHSDNRFGECLKESQRLGCSSSRRDYGSCFGSVRAKNRNWALQW